MDITQTQALVRTILEDAAGHAWTIQDIGLLGLRLDTRREYRLHVWAPGYGVGEPPIHDHPFDFGSTVVVGEITNTRYEEDPAGVEYHRVRYSPSHGDARRADTVRLSPTATTVLAAGDRYHQLAHELHTSQPTPGTVTIIRMAFTGVSELTVCSLRDEGRVSAESRSASREEVEQITAIALEHFSADVTSE